MPNLAAAPNGPGQALQPTAQPRHWAPAGPLAEEPMRARELTCRLLSPRPKRLGNSLSTRPLRLALAERAPAHPAAGALMRQKAFRSYLSYMAGTLSRLGYQACEVNSHPELAQAMLGHIAAEYRLLLEFGVSEGDIARFGHKHTLFEFQEIYHQAQALFGADGQTAAVMRTARALVLEGRFESVQRAYEEYRRCRLEVEEAFGGDEETAGVVGTVTMLIFRRGKYADAQAALAAYRQCRQEAQKAFGAECGGPGLAGTAAYQMLLMHYADAGQALAHYQMLMRQAAELFGPGMEMEARMAAAQTFKGKFASVHQALRVYRCCQKEVDAAFASRPHLQSFERKAARMLFLQNARTAQALADAYEQKRQRRLRKTRQATLGDEGECTELELSGLTPAQALVALMPIVERLAERYRSTALGHDDARQVALLSALEGMQAGHDGRAVVDRMVVAVRREGGVEASWALGRISLKTDDRLLAVWPKYGPAPTSGFGRNRRNK